MTQLAHLLNQHPNGKRTGPNSDEGKQRVAQNALRHGLASDKPVLPWESADAWDQHRQGILETLRPANSLEQELAERVALCLWRMRRVALYETAVTVVGQKDATDEMEDLSLAQMFDAEDLPPDRRLHARFEQLRREAQEAKERTEQVLALVAQLPGLAEATPIAGPVAYELVNAVAREKGLPDQASRAYALLYEQGIHLPEGADVRSWKGWSAGLLRTVLTHENRRTPLERICRRAQKDCEAHLKALALEEKQATAMAEVFCARIKERTERVQQRLRLPDEKALEKVMRFEAHLGRQFLQALHTLERWQAARAGQAVSPPAALQVTLDGAGKE